MKRFGGYKNVELFALIRKKCWIIWIKRGDNSGFFKGWLADGEIGSLHTKTKNNKQFVPLVPQSSLNFLNYNIIY